MADGIKLLNFPCDPIGQRPEHELPITASVPITISLRDGRKLRGLLTVRSEAAIALYADTLESTGKFLLEQRNGESHWDLVEIELRP